MTNTHNYAKNELEVLLAATPDAIIKEFISEMLALCEKFGLSGQSGGSAPVVSQAICHALEELLMQQPIMPIMGIDKEWVDVTEMNEGVKLFQNSRCSSLFKLGENGRPYFAEAIIFRSGKDNYFTSQTGSVKMAGESILSKQYIKSFPFTPVRFFVDVIEIEWADKTERVQKKGGGWWTFTVKDPRQLKDVLNHYDKYIYLEK